MFQPQPTPFAASCFNSYGAADLSFPLTLQALPGASSANPPPGAAPPDAARSRQQQQPRQRHHHNNQHSVPHQLQHQHHGHHNHHAHHPQQSLLYSASASASPVGAQFSPAPSHGLGSPFDDARMEQQQQQQRRRQETTGLMGEEMAAQEAAAREYQPRLEVRNCLLPSRDYIVVGMIERLAR